MCKRATDLLHLGGQCFPDCRARGTFWSGASVGPLRGARTDAARHEGRPGHCAPLCREAEEGFIRTAHRRDYAITPPRSCPDQLGARRRQAGHCVGKIGDIFSMQGIDEVRKGPDAVLMGHLNDLVATAADGSLTFANFVEFDSLYGHRRDVSGYARALEWFDAKSAG